MAATCIVNDAFMGICLGDCGRPATVAVTTTCPAGHVEHTTVCETHADVFLVGGYPMLCAACREAGEFVEAEVTTGAEVTR